MTAPLFNPCVLAIGLEEALAKSLATDLREAGYHPVTVSGFERALNEIDSLEPSMIVIDRQLSGTAGLNFCRALRAKKNPVYIILLVDRETLEERLACLEMGADDYCLKPYNTQAFLKLIGFYLQPAETVKEHLRFGDLDLDLSTRRLLYKHRPIELTMKEFELLRYLMTHPREVLSRERILDRVWGDEFQGESNIIEVYIRYLRLKMEADGQKRLIHTVRGVGYVLKDS